MISNGEKTELCYNKELMKYYDCHLLSGTLYWKLSKPREGLLASKLVLAQRQKKEALPDLGKEQDGLL